jgi:lambda repressor-like predicted transcriptional regulator
MEAAPQTGIVFVMKLEDNTNHIVSGLRRSGTSLIMQSLHAGASCPS